MEIQAAERLAALGHPARLQVMRLLMAAGVDGVAAGELARAAGLAASAATFHLDRLRLAGLARRRRLGREIRYSARFEEMRELVDFLTDTCCTHAEGEGRCQPICAAGTAGPGARSDSQAEQETP
ncbi:transcriptional regulator [Spiribacter halobius]|uniref:Transcriptional regulator n=1 Tax=Sediminicurvatus halobius TaxID=2182432 RepID=A0A2U2MW88_9GAMM|nr:transcriptional regulator [Spiribacter halobius]